MKIPVERYQRADSDWIVNGGRLIVTDTEYVLKCFFKTVARFPISNTDVEHLPLTQRYERFKLKSGAACYILYVSRKTAEAATASDLLQGSCKSALPRAGNDEK